MTVRIDPDGTVTTIDAEGHAAAAAEFTHSSVVLLVAPFLPADGLTEWVGFIDDFGAADAPINRKAWGLYGRSPIYGVMFVSRDGGGDLPPDVVTTIQADIEAWPIPEHVKSILLEADPARPDMLAPRPRSEP